MGRQGGSTLIAYSSDRGVEVDLVVDGESMTDNCWLDPASEFATQLFIFCREMCVKGKMTAFPTMAWFGWTVTST